MRARILRGSDQIGGSCVELEARGQRILLDLGMPLDAEEGEVPLPEIPGLQGGDPSLLAIVVSHLHGDHCGLVPYVSAEVPLAMGPVAARILEEAEFFTGRRFGVQPKWPLAHGHEFSIGPFTITPLEVEHSAFDAFALLVEADGRRILYTGDFRAHGNDREPFERLIRDAPRGVDVLLMEGTQVGREGDGSGPSEAQLRATLTRRMTEWPGLVLVAWSAQNLDRTRTVYEASRAAERFLALDLYAATIAAAAHAPGVPVPGADGLRIYCRFRERIQVKKAGAFERVEAIRRWRVFPETLIAQARQFTLVLRPSMLNELEGCGALRGALAIWSLWSNYLNDPAELRMQKTFARLGVPLELHHVSGHAYVDDLKRFVSAVGPKRIVPIHTAEPGRYPGLFPHVERRADGEWWEV